MKFQTSIVLVAGLAAAALAWPTTVYAGDYGADIQANQGSQQ